jgi:hypothetical protein|tara:strand:- start:1927 stop:3807 length:1881 start_codon:yes stop_codon:yes gene_type:complete
MAAPLSWKDYLLQQGVKQDESAQVLSEIHSSGGSKNVYFPRAGLVKKLEGYTKLTSSAFAAFAIRHLASFRYESGGSITALLLAVANDTLYTINESTGAETSLGTGLDTTEIPHSASIGDKFYLVSGGSANMKQYDGSTYANVGGTQPTVPTLAAGSAGNPSGNYFFRYSYILADDTIGIASPLSAAIQVKDKAITVTVTNGPAGTQGKIIWASTGDNPNFLYFAGSIDDNSTTTFSYDLTDTNLIKNEDLDRHGDAPPTGLRHVAAGAGRLWGANKDAARSALYYSGINEHASWWDLNVIRFNPQDGDEITCIVPEFMRVGETQRLTTMVVFKRWGIYNLFGVQPLANDSDPFKVEKSKSETGTVSSNTVVQIPYKGDNVLAFLSPEKDIRIYDGYTSDPVSDPIREVLDDINTQYASRSWGVHVPSKRMVFWQFAKDSNTEPNYGIGWDYRRDVWMLYPDWTTFLHAVLHHDANENELIYCGQATGATGALIYQNLTGSDFDGAAYSGIWRSKALRVANGMTTEMQVLETILEQASVTLTLKIWKGLEDPDSATEFMTTSLSGTESNQLQRKILTEIEETTGGHYLVDEEITVEYSDSAKANQWTVASFSVGHKRLPASKRASA